MSKLQKVTISVEFLFFYNHAICAADVSSRDSEVVQNWKHLTSVQIIHMVVEKHSTIWRYKFVK